MGTEEIAAENTKENKPPVAMTSYKMKPSLGETFKGVSIKEIVHEILVEKLQGWFVFVLFICMYVRCM